MLGKLQARSYSEVGNQYFFDSVSMNKIGLVKLSPHRNDITLVKIHLNTNLMVRFHQFLCPVWAKESLSPLRHLFKATASNVFSTRLEMWKIKQFPDTSMPVFHWSSFGLLDDDYNWADVSSCLSPAAHHPNQPWWPKWCASVIEAVAAGQLVLHSSLR